MIIRFADRCRARIIELVPGLARENSLAKMKVGAVMSSAKKVLAGFSDEFRFVYGLFGNQNFQEVETGHDWHESRSDTSHGFHIQLRNSMVRVLDLSMLHEYINERLKEPGLYQISENGLERIGDIPILQVHIDRIVYGLSLPKRIFAEVDNPHDTDELLILSTDEYAIYGESGKGDRPRFTRIRYNTETCTPDALADAILRCYFNDPKSQLRMGFDLILALASGKFACEWVKSLNLKEYYHRKDWRSPPYLHVPYVEVCYPEQPASELTVVALAPEHCTRYAEERSGVLSKAIETMILKHGDNFLRALQEVSCGNTKSFLGAMLSSNAIIAAALCRQLFNINGFDLVAAHKGHLCGYMQMSWGSENEIRSQFFLPEDLPEILDIFYNKFGKGLFDLFRIGLTQVKVFEPHSRYLSTEWIDDTWYAGLAVNQPDSLRFLGRKEDIFPVSLSDILTDEVNVRALRENCESENMKIHAVIDHPGADLAWCFDPSSSQYGDGRTMLVELQEGERKHFVLLIVEEIVEEDDSALHFSILTFSLRRGRSKTTKVSPWSPKCNLEIWNIEQGDGTGVVVVEKPAT